MASDVQDGGRKSREHNFEFWQYFFIKFFAISLYFDQQRDPNSYFAKIVKNGGSIQNGGSKSVFKQNCERCQYFFSINIKISQKKIQDGGSKSGLHCWKCSASAKNFR
jgi:hypothetical protein